jgi:hypothetical protein
MVERQLPKLDARVRFPSPAPTIDNQGITKPWKAWRVGNQWENFSRNPPMFAEVILLEF